MEGTFTSDATMELQESVREASFQGCGYPQEDVVGGEYL